MPKPEETERGNSARRKRRIRGVIFGLVVLAVLVMVALPLLDSVGQRWVQCQVVASNGQQGDMNATSAWVVVIDTEDCGRLMYSNGVNKDNVEEKAADFEPGAYEFKMGLTSQWAAKGFVPGVDASFEEYRPVQ